MKTKSYRKGFSLIDVLVSMILIGIGAVGVYSVFIAGRTFLSRAEIKSEAMSVAFSQMEKYLTRSYLDLVEGEYFGTEGLVDWQVKIEKKDEGPCTGVEKCIPYKEISVLATYPEKKITGNIEYKRITLMNITPYPYIHIEDEYIGDTGQLVGSGSYKKIDGLEMELSYPVNKDIMVVYNIAINVEDSSNIEADDTILTACFLNNTQRLIETRTPIVTQPLINNIIEIDSDDKGVTGGNKVNKIEIRWYKKTNVAGAGAISLRRANLIVVAFESKK